MNEKEHHRLTRAGISGVEVDCRITMNYQFIKVNFIFLPVLLLLLLSCSKRTTIPTSPIRNNAVAKVEGNITRSVKDSELDLIVVDREKVYVKTKYKDFVIEKLIDSLSNDSSSLLVFKQGLKNVAPLTRRVSKRPNLTSLASATPYKIEFDICIVPNGEVVYSKLHSVNGMSDNNEIVEIQKLMFDYLFYPDNNAMSLECGLFTIKMTGAIYK